MTPISQALDLSCTVGRLQRALRRASARAAGDSALSNAKVELLLAVLRQPGISVKEVATVLCAAANTVSTLVGDLTEAGLLLRERDPANRRVVRLALTEDGRATMTDYQDQRRRIIADAAARLPAEDRADIERALPALHRLLDVIERS
ncbi:MarR family transcriptional regulator [Allokutzneria sp. A3M-2-11 16]|uniref:MarR family winged helix-turn-helix transcriptional regulator n=1 Tax=Allokutzneria sp. A3M-2-11 16 TaxID=2962043 RepID=UPI0020B77C60|nr:MarR family transcriptional regulator [Allokutzneria sp. A3M-2-11 16]MCP3800827.1 MarR family transcriptional regulator [Allokutzneria sp. A3M-2-11 16]